MTQPRPQQQKHFVLVHGACHGAWCWYKVKPALEAAGLRVTALDLSASGINMKSIQEVFTLHDYSLPLLEFMESSIPAGEKVILVGHSLGGLSLALAMDKFPDKVSVAVFVSAFMPDSLHRPSYVLDKYNGRTPAESWLDTEFLPYSDADSTTSTSMFFGPKFLASKLYQNCSSQDLALGIMLVRKGSMFLEDLSTKASNFRAQGYGSGKRVFVVCDEDIGIPVEFQQWMIENNPVVEVKEIKGSDHMAMLSKPNELCHHLLSVAQEYT